MIWLSLFVLLPVCVIVIRSAGLGPAEFMEKAFSARALASYRVSISTALFAAIFNAFFGTLVAWVLVRYRFPLRGLVNAVVDLPFALPTAVAGISLTAVLGPAGWLGRPLAALDIQVVFTPLGITIALAFIGLPFVVRAVQPVLEQLSNDLEAAAATLGAEPDEQFRRIILPLLLPAILTGFALALARGLGEYGAVVFISGNLPLRTEIAPLLILTQLEQFDYAAAAAIATVMLGLSMLLLICVNLLQSRLLGREVPR